MIPKKTSFTCGETARNLSAPDLNFSGSSNSVLSTQFDIRGSVADMCAIVTSTGKIRRKNTA
jgi:hypothetical protein